MKRLRVWHLDGDGGLSLCNREVTEHGRNAPRRAHRLCRYCLQRWLAARPLFARHWAVGVAMVSVPDDPRQPYLPGVHNER